MAFDELKLKFLLLPGLARNFDCFRESFFKGVCFSIVFRIIITNLEYKLSKLLGDALMNLG